MLQQPQRASSTVVENVGNPLSQKASMAPAQPVAAGRSYAPRILIIEDEFLIALLIEEMSRHLGYRVSGIAHNVTAARMALKKRDFDAVLLDINLDGRAGPDIADLLAKMAIPFAFVTGYEYAIEPRHEAVPILEKPFSPSELRAFLERLVGPASLKRATA